MPQFWTQAFVTWTKINFVDISSFAKDTLLIGNSALNMDCLFRYHAMLPLNRQNIHTIEDFFTHEQFSDFT